MFVHPSSTPSICISPHNVERDEAGWRPLLRPGRSSPESQITSAIHARGNWGQDTLSYTPGPPALPH